MEPVTAANLKAFLQRLIEFDELERLFQAVLPRAAQADIIPQEFRDYFEEIRRRIAAGSSRPG